MGNAENSASSRRENSAAMGGNSGTSSLRNGLDFLVDLLELGRRRDHDDRLWAVPVAVVVICVGREAEIWLVRGRGGQESAAAAVAAAMAWSSQQRRSSRSSSELW